MTIEIPMWPFIVTGIVYLVVCIPAMGIWTEEHSREWKYRDAVKFVALWPITLFNHVRRHW